MTHPHDDRLLLHSYGELPESERPGLEAHLVSCAECRGCFARLEESRIAIAWGLEGRPRRGARRLLWLALPLAAGISALLLARQPDRQARPADLPRWQSHLRASPNAGYLTTSLFAIDSQLVQLEQGRIHASPRN